MIGKSFTRSDRSILGEWWWTIDRWLFFAMILLMVAGVFLSFAASPSVAQKIGVEPFFFVKRHVLFLIPSLFCMIFIASCSPPVIRFLCWGLFFIFLFFLILTLVMGFEAKGARRWINVFGFSLQASEFIKPTFCVISAWLLSRLHYSGYWSPRNICIMFYLFLMCLVLLQPDFGMAFVISVVWFFQFYLTGLSILWTAVLGVLGVSGVGVAYVLFPHVASRIDRFLNPASGDQYQITRSLEAFRHGGFFGRGPGEGLIKHYLPDSHADFVFSVAGEEFGFFFCIFILFLFLCITGRCLWHARKAKEFFLTLAISGISVQFAVQSLIHMASSLHLIPTKGMTLPFLSYGGSSLLAISLGMGVVLGLTRRRLQDEA